MSILYINRNRIISIVLAFSLIMTSVAIAPQKAYAADDAFAAKADSSLNKINIPSPVKKNKSITITFVGHNQDLQSPAIGDTRYVPYGYEIEGPNYFYEFDFFDDPPYSAKIKPDAYGTYTIEAEYNLEEYYYDMWHSTSTYVTKKATFKVVGEKYKIKLNANKGKLGKKTTKTKSVTVGETYGKLPIPKRKGYTFLSWGYKKSTENLNLKKLDKAVTSKTKVKKTKTHTLYARWIKNDRLITKSNYNRIKKGMTYAQVTSILGSESVYKKSESYFGYKIVAHGWIGSKAKWVAAVAFVDGYVYQKEKSNL